MIVLALLGLASPFVRPVWRALDPGLEVALALEPWREVDRRPLMGPFEPSDSLARMALLPVYRLASFAPIVVLGLALSYGAARALRTISSLPRDVAASLLVGLPALLPSIALARILSGLEPDTAGRLPWSGGSVVLSVAGTLTLMVLAVRRWHGLEP